MKKTKIACSGSITKPEKSLDSAFYEPDYIG